MKKNSSSLSKLAALLGFTWGIACGILPAQAQITASYAPNAWVNDPYTPNTAWGITAPNTSSPTYTNNGLNYNNNLYGYSPIGTTITLAKPGDTVTLTAQVTTSGDVAYANLQFRFGIVYKGASANDTGWAGSLISLPNTGSQAGLYEEKIPNTATFSTGSSANTQGSGTSTFVTGSQSGTIAYTLSVTYLSSTANLVCWTAQGLNGNAYIYTGRYTNTTAATQGGFNYDTVGFLKGGSVFTANSTANAIAFANVLVTFGSFGDGAWAGDNSGTWSTTGNWVNGVPANGSGFIANFGAVDLTADRTVILDTSRSVGAMIFGATSGSVNNWILNSTGGSILSLNNNGLATVPNIAVTNNMATLDLSVDSTNGLAESGAGLLILAGNNSIVGPLDLNGGELSFSSLANLPLSSAGISAINFGGGALQWAAGNTLDISALGITIGFAGNGGFDTGANNVTFTQPIGDGGVGGLTKLGTGTLTFDNYASYAGTTTVSNGVLALGSSGSIPSSSNIVVLTNATLDVSALGSSGLALSGQNQFLSGAGTVNGSLSDSSGTTIGAGFAATGAAGTLTINGGLTLNSGSILTFGLANVTDVGGGTNDLIAVSGNLDIAGPTAINVNLISGAPGLGTYTLFTYGSFSGSAANLTAPLGYSVINTGSSIGLVVTHVPQNLTWKGDGSANVWDTDTTENWLDGGLPAYFFAGDSVTFNATGSDNPYINLDVNVSPASVTVNSSGYDFAGTGGIATGKLTTSTGTLILENNNTYTGPTVISGGVLQVGGPTLVGTAGTLGTGRVTNNGALVFDLAQNYTVTTNIYGTGSITNIGSAGTITLSGNISGSTVNQASSGAAMVLSGSNTYTGQTIVSSGSLHPRNNFALSKVAVSTVVSNGGQIYIDLPNLIITNKLSLAGPGIANDGALRVGGGGLVTVGGAISLMGDTQFQVDGGSTLILTNPATITGIAGALSTNVTLGADANGVGTFIAPLSLGGGSLTVQDAGVWTIAPSNNYTGLTSLNGSATAILEIAGTNALGPISSFNAAYVTLNGGTLATSNNITFNDGLRGFTVNGGTGGFDVAGGATLVIANPITGGGTLTKGTAGTVDDSGTLVLSGSNSFNGTLYVDSGNNVVNDGTFEVAGSYAIANVLSPIAIRNTLGGASTFALDGSSGNIVVTQDITLTGRSPNIPAILNIAGTNTLAGNLTNGGAGGRYIIESDSGLLTMGSPGTYLSFSTTDPQTLTFQGNGSFFVLGTISDGTNATTTFTSITKAGSGSMTLQALNTYSGSTTVTGGALIVNGAIASGTNAQLVTISGGSLGGTGVINAPVTVGAAGTFAPGAPLGTLTINSNLTLAGNTLVSVSAPSTCSQVAGLTALTYGGTLTVTNVGGALAAGNSFQIFPATIGTGNFTSVSGSAGGGLGFTFNPTTGVLSVVSVIPSTPTNITYSVSSGSITLNWPSSYTGWILQAQTNSAGIGTDWFDVAGTASTDSWTMPIGLNNPTVFLRLRHP